MSNYDFSKQQQLFEIAYQILEDYNIKEWSFGGGTALSYCYYQHRMSYDIDIFSEDYSSIGKLIENQKEIASNLGIELNQIESSASNITFILESDNAGLKLDFLYGTSLTSTPYESKNIFGFSSIKVQTPLEIIARKLKYRETLTIRDFLDFGFSEQKHTILTLLKSEKICDIDRFFEINEQFQNFNEESFNQELLYLNSNSLKTKADLNPIITNLMIPHTFIKVATDNTEIVAFDEFIEMYRETYEEIGSYDVYTIEKDKILKYLNKDSISYEDVLNLTLEELQGIRN